MEIIIWNWVSNIDTLANYYFCYFFFIADFKQVIIFYKSNYLSIKTSYNFFYVGAAPQENFNFSVDEVVITRNKRV